jgi:mRNA interferase YafQ
MLQARFTTQFKKDRKLMISRHKDDCKLKGIIDLIIQEKSLPNNANPHLLHGEYAGCIDCHIEPNWILVYKVDEKQKRAVFRRTGTHADLF